MQVKSDSIEDDCGLVVSTMLTQHYSHSALCASIDMHLKTLAAVLSSTSELAHCKHRMQSHNCIHRSSDSELRLLLQVVGEREEAEGTVNVRTRDNVVHGMHPVESVKQVLLEEKAMRSLTSMFSFHEDAVARGPADQHMRNGAPVAAAAAAQ